jgi:hypothetical protein
MQPLLECQTAILGRDLGVLIVHHVIGPLRFEAKQITKKEEVLLADRVPPALRDCLLRRIVDLATNLGNASPQAEANIK